ncbi:MAG: nucleotidyltransferase domain-containing protein [Chloroflexi bacterium]|nr:nucleotidyltransferase domain-containing protein [Chloroflexota bacterium]
MTASAPWEAVTEDALNELRRRGRLSDATVILIGSVARNVATPESDVDVLVVTPEPLSRWGASSRLHLLLLTRSKFVGQLRSGDDFPQWVARFGRVLSDESGWWQRFLDEPSLAAWPDWKRKREQGAQRLSFASRLYESGDCDNAQEEYLLSTGHVARSVLLRAGLFPLSRPELQQQLRDAGNDELADALKTLASDSAAPAVLKRIDGVIRSNLERLSNSEVVFEAHESEPRWT